MQYLLSFLEGIFTFLSPCLLPMLPVYLSYFAGGQLPDEKGERRGSTLRSALGFVAGFTLVFVALGAFAGSLGRLLLEYQVALNLITGGIVILFGLSYLGLFHLPFLQGNGGKMMQNFKGGFFPSLLFGLVFSVAWTPCVGAFLSSALALAAQQGTTVQGILMLLSFSAGLGIPFVLSALFLHRLKSTFDWIKAHYVVVNRVSGGILILVGVAMATGYMNMFLSLLTF